MMTFFSKRKRKNDDPPRSPAWIIVLIAIGLVVIVALLLPTSTSQSDVVVIPAGSTFTTDPIELMATYVIKQATAIAQGTPQSAAVQSGNIDPLMQTATAIVKLATEQAVTPGS
jgi:hypothetical protein